MVAPTSRISHQAGSVAEDRRYDVYADRTPSIADFAREPAEAPGSPANDATFYLRFSNIQAKSDDVAAAFDGSGAQLPVSGEFGYGMHQGR